MLDSQDALQSHLTEVEKRRARQSARRIFCWKKLVPYGLMLVVLANLLWSAKYPSQAREFRRKALRGGLSVIGVDPDKFPLTRSSNEMPRELMEIKTPDQWNSWSLD